MVFIIIIINRNYYDTGLISVKSRGDEFVHLFIYPFFLQLFIE